MAEKKRIFLLVDDSEEQLDQMKLLLAESYSNCTVYTAKDGQEGLMKLENVPPDLMITALELPKFSGAELIRIALKKDTGLCILALTEIPEEESLKFQHAIPRIQFTKTPLEKEAFLHCVNLALGFIEQKNEDKSFGVRFLSAGQYLFRAGDKADSAFLLKKGRLQAIRADKEKTTVLGEILPGEFVGEMAHITGELRSADVLASENSELVEIPVGTLDILLFSKPAWSRALMKSLAQRLRVTNTKI